jgi:hypothetical protein
VGADPVQRDAGLGLLQGVELLDEVEVLDRTALARPTAAGPAGGPFVDRVDAELAVGVDDEIAVVRQRLERLDQGAQLHPVVGRVRLAAVALGLDLPVLDPDPAPAAGAGVGLAGAVGEDAVLGAVEMGLEDFLGRESAGRALRQGGRVPFRR